MFLTPEGGLSVIYKNVLGEHLRKVYISYSANSTGLWTGQDKWLRGEDYEDEVNNVCVRENQKTFSVNVTVEWISYSGISRNEYGTIRGVC